MDGKYLGAVYEGIVVPPRFNGHAGSATDTPNGCF